MKIFLFQLSSVREWVELETTNSDTAERVMEAFESGTFNDEIPTLTITTHPPPILKVPNTEMKMDRPDKRSIWMKGLKGKISKKNTRKFFEKFGKVS